MGQISLEGIEFYARHGYYKEERVIGNKYAVDVTLDVNFTRAIKEDKLEGTINYERVYEIVKKVMTTEALLLEHLAGKMIKSLKNTFPTVTQVEVKISKYNPPIKGLCERAVVTLKG